jgi:hypothetical protein
MLDAKIVDRVVVEAHAAGQPAVGIVRSAEAVEFASTADALGVGIEP